MPIKSCANCGSPCQPVPQVPDQRYCSQAACQRARRQRWYQKKLECDPDYRDNKRRVQRKWMDQNPNYWRQYRIGNPEYADKNRRRQRVKVDLPTSSVLAKIDASGWPQTLKAGIYRITPVHSKGAGKNGAWIVEISPACANPNCKNDACKGDACKDSA